MVERCEFCGKRFKNRDSLLRHLRASDNCRQQINNDNNIQVLKEDVASCRMPQFAQKSEKQIIEYNKKQHPDQVKKLTREDYEKMAVRIFLANLNYEYDGVSEFADFIQMKYGEWLKC